MSPTELRPAGPALCVSIHDVAPCTWDACRRLAAALREVADIPLTWLVVPAYHRDDGDVHAARIMKAGLDEALARGDELTLHGYTHLDTSPRGEGWRDRFLRGAYSREGEFAALTEAEAARRIRLGLDWFAAQGWPASGFVPPAWLMGEDAWRALRRFPFAYTTTFSRFHLLPGRAGAAVAGGAAQAGEQGEQGGRAPSAGEAWLAPGSGGNTGGNGHGGSARSGGSAESAATAPGEGGAPPLSVYSPSLVYAARNRSGRLVSPVAADLMAAVLARAPLIRLSLHPPDLRYPRLLGHAQRTVERLLAHRTPMTKAAFARRLTSMVPSNPRHASSAVPSLRNTMDCCQGDGARPWC